MLNSAEHFDGTQAKTIKLESDIETSVQLIGIYHDERAGGEDTRFGVVLAFAGAVAERPMYEGESLNVGGWGLDLCEWLSQVLEEKLPDDLHTVIEPAVRLISTDPNRTNNTGWAAGVWKVGSTADRLWFHLVAECVGDPRWRGVWSGQCDYLNDRENAGVQYKLFRDAGVVSARKSGAFLRDYAGDASGAGGLPGMTCQCWLRSPRDETDNCISSEFAEDEPDGATGAMWCMGWCRASACKAYALAAQ